MNRRDFAKTLSSTLVLGAMKPKEIFKKKDYIYLLMNRRHSKTGHMLALLECPTPENMDDFHDEYVAAHSRMNYPYPSKNNWAYLQDLINEGYVGSDEYGPNWPMQPVPSVLKLTE